MVMNRKGWTLMELLIVVAIVGVLALVIPQVLSLTVKNFVLGRAKIELQRESRSTAYLITRELRQAQSNTIVIDQAVGQPFYSRIRFTKIQGTPVTIAQKNNLITLTEGNTTSTLTKNLEYMSFSFPESDDMTIASISFTLQQQIYGLQYKALHMASESVRVMN